MRELKFRVWCKRTQDYHTQIDYDAEPNGPWLQMCIDTNGRLYFIETSNEDADFEYVTHDCEIIEDQNDNFIIEQYTGLKDKNSKEIYEGDIVRNTEEVAPNKSSTYKIYYDQSHAMYGMLPVDGKIDIGDFYSYKMRYQFEIIGNIHENPELLGKEEK